MVGKGAIVFALMGFIIARMQCRWIGEGRAKTVVEGTVRLNPQVLATIFGEPTEKIEEGIKVLTSPDPATNLPDEEGRRLVQIGPFDYRVVNAAHYQNKRDEAEQREKTKERVAQWRAAQKAEECSTGNNGTKRELWVDACKVYDLYPRKVGKQAAVRKIASAIKEFGFEKVLEATKTYAQAWNGQVDLQFCPHPATWFGQHRFNDDPATWVRNDVKKLPESREIHEEIEIPKL